jgi:hypothetical protein
MKLKKFWGTNMPIKQRHYLLEICPCSHSPNNCILSLFITNPPTKLVLKNKKKRLFSLICCDGKTRCILLPSFRVKRRRHNMTITFPKTC